MGIHARDGLEEGLALYLAGAFWHAHEAWERDWMVAPPNAPERWALQGLIQLANARLKLSQGHVQAARRILERAAEALERGRGAALPGLPEGFAESELAEMQNSAL